MCVVMVSLMGTRQTFKFSDSGTTARVTMSLQKHLPQQPNEFDGAKIRTFDGTRMTLDTIQTNPVQRRKASCSNWNVVSTRFAPSAAVLRAASLPGWCTVIVADAQTPTDYLEQAGLSGNPYVHFLSVKDQKKLEELSGHVGSFIKAIPYEPFARKNIGYLYAMQHSTNVIFDFDDNNLLDLDAEGNVVSPLPNTTKARMAMIGNKHVFNHHPLMEASVPGSWARGFPLSQIDDNSTHGFVAYDDEPWKSMHDPTTNIAVLQICANGDDPDIDAIHRWVKPRPMTFAKTTNQPLIVPTHHVFAPYNAQSTVHSAKAHWALLLPLTVPERVSDIWRGYFAQALFRTLDMHIAFSPPSVTQDRNQHSHLADAKAEFDLYMKTGKLVGFLGHWQCAGSSLPQCMEQLWIDLYEREYIELNDVHLVQLWLGALMESGYEFPTMIHRRHADVVLMGQFNYPNSFSDVLFWNQKYRKWFDRIVVRGPFSDVQLEKLHAHGIDAHVGRNDKGFVSPLENLMRTLKQYQGTDGVTGVLYAHDDAVVRMPRLFQKYPTRDQHVLANFDTREPRKPEDANHIAFLNNVSYTIQPDGTFVKQNGVRANSTAQLMSTLNSWEHHPSCIRQFLNVIKDPRSQNYREEDGSFLVAGKGQSDFLYVPINLTDVFSDVAQLFTDYDVFLECAFPTLVDILRHTFGASVRHAELCTSWDRSIRGTSKMLDNCDAIGPFDVYHPYKITSHGYRIWSRRVGILTSS